MTPDAETNIIWDIFLAICLIFLILVGCGGCKTAPPDGTERVTIIYIDDSAGIKAALSARVTKDGIPKYYVPKMDTVYAVDSTGKPTGKPLLFNGKVQTQLFWYDIDPKLIQIIAPKPYK